jgi:hypothetical protein
MFALRTTTCCAADLGFAGCDDGWWSRERVRATKRLGTYSVYMAGLGVVQRAKTPHLCHGSSLGEKCEVSRCGLRMMSRTQPDSTAATTGPSARPP